MSNSFLGGGPGRSKCISVAEADEILADFQIPLAFEAVDLADAIGRQLLSAAVADRPIPAFDRVCMDGYALSSEAFASGRRAFRVVGSVRAGEPAKTLPDIDACLEVMTGSVLPQGCDAVVAVERTERIDDATVRLLVQELVAGANIHARGRDRKIGDEVVPSPIRIGPGEIAALASLGVVRPLVLQRLRIAVASSGDELVEPSRVPLPHQIRQSNVWGIAASLEQAGYRRPEIRHAKDDPTALRRLLDALVHGKDVVILSGGVSMGKWDLVPAILREIGVDELFHGVAQQPGMPLWMGLTPAGGLVAGLPGSPVAALTCLARYVHPILERSEIRPSRRQRVVLGESIQRAPTKTRFAPVRKEIEDGVIRVFAGRVDGSGDWAGLVGTDGAVELAPGSDVAHAGTPVDFHPW